MSGSKTADMKAAIVEAFRDRKTILIATESGAEGINLQFCSLVVNFDLPWNPQRVEQRIGRCHRYGQKIDVTVVNFLNLKNHAEQRIHQLLDQKFNLFKGVFGASDEVLGVIERGVDIERRIFQIVQSARTETEIDAAFDKLQDELKRRSTSKCSTRASGFSKTWTNRVIDRLKDPQGRNRRASFPTSTNSFSTSRAPSFPTPAFMQTTSAASTIAATPTRPNGRSPTKGAGSSSACWKARWRRMSSTGPRNAGSTRPHACASTLPPIPADGWRTWRTCAARPDGRALPSLDAAVTREQLVISVVADDGSTVHPETVGTDSSAENRSQPGPSASLPWAADLTTGAAGTGMIVA